MKNVYICTRGCGSLLRNRVYLVPFLFSILTRCVLKKGKMSQESPSQNYYAVITAPVLYCKSLTARQKLLFAVITNMSNKKGYCFASNSHLSDITGTSTRTIQRDLNTLEDLGFLGRVVKLKPNGEVKFRGLRPMSEVSIPHDTDVTTPHDTSVTIKTNSTKNKKKNTLLNDRTDKNNMFRFFDWLEQSSEHEVTEAIHEKMLAGMHPPANLLPKNILKELVSRGAYTEKGRLKYKDIQPNYL